MAERLPPWTVTRSEQVVRDRWIDLRADHCVTAEGEAVSPYYVLRYPDWVQVAAVDREDRLLLVEQYRHGLGATSLELPGGGVEPGDADPLAAGRRELMEETGYGGGRWRLLASLSPNPASHANRLHVLLAEGVERLGPPRTGLAERLLLRPVPPEEAARLAIGGAVVQAMHVAALAIALTALGRWPGRC